ncbi:MAG: saccharopine dehydrogenase NADP-binding domain-containing protein [Thermoplasmata archaeon]|nr:saccharopine dehydrogenase NADP-binding domain-containing protein [Thermoplasmata archaeon]
MKVVQLGCGITGLVCAEELAGNAKVTDLVLADSRTEGAEALSRRLGSDKIDVVKTDATDKKAIAEALADSDVVVCSLPWDLNGRVLETAVDKGVNYVDFCISKEAFDDFDKVDRMCKNAGITAITAVGLEPGISDTLARYAANKLDSVEEAHVIDGDNGVVEGGGFVLTWSPIDWIDELCVPAAVFRDGKIEYIPPLREKETYEFPQPIGTLPVYKTLHDETFLMPKHIKGIRNADFRIGVDDEFAMVARMLKKLGLHRKEPVDVKGVKVSPLDVVVALMPRPVDLAGKIKGHGGTVVEITGKKDGKRTMIKMWAFASHEKSYDRYGTNATGYLVGIGGAVPTEMLIEGMVKEKGLLVPEQLPAEEFVRRLKEKGLAVNEKITAF